MLVEVIIENFWLQKLQIYMFSSSKGLRLFINEKKDPVLLAHTPFLK